MEPKRYFIELAYNGTAYHGWQIQENAVSVQQRVNEVISLLLRREIETVGCGRTDTGVHARQLYAHFDDAEGILSYNTTQYLHRINRLLPKDIAAKGLFEVAPEAHARFDAVSRSYEYHMHRRKDPFLDGLSWQQRELPDVRLMNEACRYLIEATDFSSFSKSHTQVFTNNCRLTRAEWLSNGPDRLIFHISADRFLRNMVRAIVGTLMEIGTGRQPVEYIQAVLESKDRSAAGASVPAEGLYLTQVNYPYPLLKKSSEQVYGGEQG